LTGLNCQNHMVEKLVSMWHVNTVLCNGPLHHLLDLRAHLLSNCFAICEEIPHRAGRSGLVLAEYATYPSKPVHGARVRASASGLHLFGAQYPPHLFPCLRFACSSRCPAQNSGPSRSLVLSRKNLAFSASCPFSPAHCNGDISPTIIVPNVLIPENLPPRYRLIAR
jgi:hypothetical protein